MHIGDGQDPPPTATWTVAVELLNSFNYLRCTVMNTGDLHE